MSLTDAPSLPSFEEVLSPTTLLYLYSTGLFETYLHPVFNAYRFPIYVDPEPALLTESEQVALADVFNQRGALTMDDCHTYNTWLQLNGFVQRVPLSLRGVCTKDKTTCKQYHRHSCGGCGRTWVPGSLRDPACVVHPTPWWASYMEREITEGIAHFGGVSKTDPLVWFPVGMKRNGRTQHYDPSLDDSA